MRAYLLSAPLLLALSATAPAQPAATTVLTPLPSPDLPEGAGPSDYLRAARRSVAAGRLGEAEDALEMAQTRILDRSVPLGHTDDPSGNPAVAEIAHARQALAAGDRAETVRAIDTALKTVSAGM